MRSALVAAQLLIAAAADASPIVRSGWTDPASPQGANVFYWATPSDRFFAWAPTRYEVSIDDMAGTVSINRWEIYDDTRTQLAYSFAPQTFQLTLNSLGQWTAPAPFGSIVMYPRGLVDAKLHLFVRFEGREETFPTPILSIFPGAAPWILDTLTVQIPEPKTAAMMLLSTAAAGVIMVPRRRRHAARLKLGEVRG
jgi:hypothetical protein